MHHPDELPAAAGFYRRWGFVVLRDLVPADVLAALEAECAAAQQGVLAGTVAPRHGSTKYLDDARASAVGGAGEPFVNYVERVEELAPSVATALGAAPLRALLT